MFFFFLFFLLLWRIFYLFIFSSKGQETQSVFLFIVCPGMTCIRCRSRQTKKLKAFNCIKMAWKQNGRPGWTDSRPSRLPLHRWAEAPKDETSCCRHFGFMQALSYIRNKEPHFTSSILEQEKSLNFSESCKTNKMFDFFSAYFWMRIHGWFKLSQVFRAQWKCNYILEYIWIILSWWHNNCFTFDWFASWWTKCDCKLTILSLLRVCTLPSLVVRVTVFFCP